MKMINKSIVTKLNAIVLIIVIFGLAAIAFSISYYNYKISLDNLENKSVSTLKLAKVSLAGAIWDMNDDMISEIADSILIDEDVMGLVVYSDSEDEVLKESVKKPLEKMNPKLLSKNENYIIRSTEIQREGSFIGKIYIAFQKQRTKSVIEKAATFIMLLSLVLAVIIGVSVTITAHKIVKKPIQELEQSAESLANGNLNANIPTGRIDEIGHLSKSFSKMRDAIREKINQIEEYNRTLEQKVDDRTKELNKTLEEVTEEKEKIKNILDDIDEGIFTFLENGKIAPQYSAFMESFYKTDNKTIQNKPFYELIFPGHTMASDQYDVFIESIKTIVGEDYINWELNSEHIPREIVIKVDEEEKVIALSWKPIVKGSIVQNVMVTIRDLTSQKKLEKQAEEEKRKNQLFMEKISQIIKIDRFKVTEFLKKSADTLSKYIDSNNLNQKNSLKLDLHTIKGEARTLDLSYISQEIHELETKISSDDIDNFSILHSGLSEVKDYQRVIKEVLTSPEESSVDQRRPLFMSLQSITSQILPSLKSHIQENNATLAEFSCNDSILDWNVEVLKKLNQILIHALFNCVDHGYLEKNVSPSINVKLSVSAIEKNNMVQIDVTDWGKGINESTIKKIAKEKNIDISKFDNIFDILFEADFTSSKKISETSGRGVGLTAIRQMAKSLNGHVSIKNNDTGSTISIWIPSEIAANRRTYKKVS